MVIFLYLMRTEKNPKKQRLSSLPSSCCTHIVGLMVGFGPTLSLPLFLANHFVAFLSRSTMTTLCNLQFTLLMSAFVSSFFFSVIVQWLAFIVRKIHTLPFRPETDKVSILSYLSFSHILQFHLNQNDVFIESNYDVHVEVVCSLRFPSLFIRPCFIYAVQERIHQECGSLPAHFISQLRDYLPSHPQGLSSFFLLLINIP